MQHFNTTFAEYCEESFSEYSSAIFVNMKKTNKEYMKLCKEREKLKEDNPKLKMIIEGFEVPKMTKITRKDVYDLRNYVDIIYKIHYLEYREMFFMGKKEEFYSLKNMGIIK